MTNKIISRYQEYTKQHTGTVISADEAQNAFKVHSQLRKYNERKEEIPAEITAIEGLLKDSLQFFEGRKIPMIIKQKLLILFGWKMRY